VSRTVLPMPTLGQPVGPAHEPIRVWVDLDRRYHLSIYSLGLACCAVEFVALATGELVPDAVLVGGVPAPELDAAQVLVVSGTVTDKMAPIVRRVFEAMPEPRYVISFGACSNCGGPYWDSYCVTKGVGQILPVDVYVPGCPPRPQALLHAIDMLRDKIAGLPVAG
jgi:NADH-quinone oxidoreductase B subunit